MQAVATSEASERVQRAWAVLDTVPDPEVPVVSVCELGIVRDVLEHDDALEIIVTPTYSGCPATEVIASDIIAALTQAGLARPVSRCNALPRGRQIGFPPPPAKNFAPTVLRRPAQCPQAKAFRCALCPAACANPRRHAQCAAVWTPSAWRPLVPPLASRCAGA